jgi:hypothetical protein
MSPCVCGRGEVTDLLLAKTKEFGYGYIEMDVVPVHYVIEAYAHVP